MTIMTINGMAKKHGFKDWELRRFVTERLQNPMRIGNRGMIGLRPDDQAYILTGFGPWLDALRKTVEDRRARRAEEKADSKGFGRYNQLTRIEKRVEDIERKLDLIVESFGIQQKQKAS